MSALRIVNSLKENGQDFEFYPTTNEILEAMYWDINGKIQDEKTYRAGAKEVSILDIGAGNCKLFNKFKEIAESQPLLDEIFYHSIDNAEYYSKCIPLQIKSRLSTRDLVVVFKDEHNEEIEKELSMDEFMLMFKNTSIENIDTSSLEWKHERLDITEKDIVIERIEDYKPSSYCRTKSDREANRVQFKKYMAIEKSQILIDKMPSDVFVVGTDFNENTLIDKQANVVFCNPPYSEYSYWSERIIKEANAEVIYLVIPKRWGGQANIANAIKQRRARVTIVGDFDFLQSEDRKARAYVSLIKIDLKGKPYINHRGYKTDREEIAVDPFDLWFNETFKINAKKEEEYAYEAAKAETNKAKERINNALVNGSDLVSALVELYNQEINKLTTNYLKLSELDGDILKELNVDIANLLKAFKEKITGLKNFYWKEIFDNLDAITSRLTSRTRRELLDTLMTNTNIDFTSGNIRSVIIWVIKNANKYFDSQMLEIYDNFTTEEGIKLYKSNANFLNDTWRYCKGEKDTLGKYALDYRIVCHGYNNGDSSIFSFEQFNYLNDIAIVAKNLGFDTKGTSRELLYLKEKHNICFSSNSQEIYKKGTKTLDGKIEEVYFHTDIPLENGKEVMEKDGATWVYCPNIGTPKYQYKVVDSSGYASYLYSSLIRTEKDIFTTVRGYGNGNVHFQFNKEFIKKLNLEVGRLRGWLKSPSEATEQFDITLEEANLYWNSTFTLIPENLNALLPGVETQAVNKNEDDKMDTCPQCEQEDILNEHGLCSVCQKRNDEYDDENPIIDNSKELLLEDAITINIAVKKEIKVKENNKIKETTIFDFL